MKYIKSLAVLVMLLVAFSSCEDSKKVSEVVHDKYFGTEGFSEIVLPPRFINGFVSKDKTDQKELLKTIEDLRIMFFDNDLEGNKGKTTLDYVTNLLDKRGFEELMSIDKDGQYFTFKAKQKNDIIKELHVLIGGENKVILASFTGNIDFEQVSKVMDDFDVDDFDGLENFSGGFNLDDINIDF